jgi:hypothetical protein
MIDSTDSLRTIDALDGTRNHPIPRQSNRIAFGIVRPRSSTRTADRPERLVESII